MNVRTISVIFQLMLWVATFILTVIWIFWPDPPFEPEPLTVALGLIATAVSTLLSKYADRLHVEEFSLADALAVGYVNNFIEPILTQLIKQGRSPKFYIYIPARISDLSPRNIDRLVSSLKEANLNNKTVTFEQSEGRGARDVMTIINAEGANIYFDFPSTLLTLSPLIEFKVETKKDSFDSAKKDEMGKLYISKFKQTVEKLLVEKSLYPKYIEFVHSLGEIKFIKPGTDG